jgi:uncharacterized membrane protein
MQWYYAVNGQQQGPVEQDELFSLARDGKLKGNDLVWNSTMGAQWAKASTIPGLFDHPVAAGGAVPPPLEEWSSETQFKSVASNRDLMADARAALAGNWGLAVGAVLVYLLVMVVLAIPYLGSILSFIITGPLMLGWYLFFLMLARRQPGTVGMIFEGFKQFGTGFLAYLLMALLVFAWALPGIVVIIVMAVLSLKPILAGETPSVGTMVILVPLAILALIPAMIAQFRYSMTYFVINATPGIGPMEAIRRSSQIMRGNKWKLFCLQCRFIGWSFLCLFTLGIGFLWLTPYMMTSQAAFYEELTRGHIDV